MRDYGISMVAPSSSQDAPPSMEEIDHNIQTLKRLIGASRAYSKRYGIVHGGAIGRLRLPKRSSAFSYASATCANGATNSCRDRRDFRRAVYGVPEASAPEGRPWGTQSGISQAIRSLEDLAFRLEEKRLHLVVGYGHLEDDMPDVDPLTDLFVADCFMGTSAMSWIDPSVMGIRCP